MEERGSHGHISVWNPQLHFHLSESHPILGSQLKATFYGKSPNPYRDHLALLVPPSSLGTNMFTYSVG